MVVEYFSVVLLLFGDYQSSCLQVDFTTNHYKLQFGDTYPCIISHHD